ncbi:exodeoxyribonuclease V subunit beta [Pleurocapsa sp. PCC 7319]|uniref:UvrD-helicase domain-containing protein n=1 Tax=Pleurocapsa sp. PCC 7319 TaxID=118161 RepID=UPI00034AE957|nr:UvrD-helicase domain-containing protein [Pleurocapsa sp. PCC 7319]
MTKNRNTNLTLEQQAAAYAPCSVVITAGAGTGKTHMLAERYLYYLRERNLSPLEIVAVTFTEKAAIELRSRIRALVNQQLPQRLDLLAELEAAQISTIHALAGRICQEHFQVLQIPADFQVLDDLEGQVWLEDALQKALTKLPQQVFQAVPYSLLQDVLRRLLDDPYTAEQALRQGIQDWSKLIANARTQAVKLIVNDPVWQSTWETLDQHQGKEGDKLETIRQSVLEAMTDLEEAENIDRAITIIDQVNLRVGSKKNWQDDGLKTVKDALKSLRESVRRVINQGLFDLELCNADEKLELMLPALTEAYQEVTGYLSHLKLQRKVLTFNDLEIYALQALAKVQVQEYYRQRWQVFLVDEFQDTNPTQAELLNTLTAKAELTIVGDIKQSIYGFRRADIRVFEQFRRRILANNGKEVILSTSFRTHQTLISLFNQIFAPLLAEKHQDLTAYRQETPIQEQAGEIFHYLQVLTIGDRFLKQSLMGVSPKTALLRFKQEGEDKSSKPNKAQRQRVEAYCLAEKIKQMLDNKTPVFDKQTRRTRPMEPKDIAILTRTWQPLEMYSEALAAVGIPVAPAGGGNLLATREAKDASALLRFLANPRDDIALVAVLRSPFFAISDRLLFQVRNSFKQSDRDSEDNCWWDELKTAQFPELKHSIQVLQQLLKQRQSETPSRIIQIADRLTGYTAVIANLAGAARRLADWQGFQQLVKNLEQGTYDLFGVVRRLKRLYDQEVAVSRPVLAVTNAVSLMTIFAAKGLEWSLVIVADLSKERPKLSPSVRFDAQLGVAIKSKDYSGEMQKPVLYSWLEYLQEQKEREEAVRVLYVALTRARDYLILSAAEPYKGELNRLQRGLTAAKISSNTIPYNDNKALPPTPQTSPIPEHLPPLLLNSVGSGLSELPVTALTDYARCPQRFKLRLIDGHPGLGEGLAYGMQIGTLVHKALEHNLTQAQDLLPFAEGDWSAEVFTEAISLAQRFFHLPMYQHFRQTAVAKEQQISLKLGHITFNGVIDLVGNNWVLDYKSDRQVQPADHRFQLGVYAQALGHNNAHIAYLRHDYIHSFSRDELIAIAQETTILAQKIHAGDYTATPTMVKCAICPYIAFCDDAMI